MLSIKAIKAFQNLPTSKVDREWHDTLFLERLFEESFIVNCSNENWKKRRNAAIKTFGLNFVSHHIPLIITKALLKIDSLKVGEKYDFLEKVQDITFQIISILFGKNLLKMSDE